MIEGTNGTNETTNYGYPQFVAEDKPGWLTDWNKTMEAIDENEAGIQTQVTENKENLEAIEMTVERHEEELNGEHGAFQRIADNQNRIQDLEEKVGDDEHGLVKDMIDVKRDLTETNTMAVKTNGAVNSIRDLICNPFVATSQYNAGAYVYLQDADDGEIHYYKCNTTHRGAFDPNHFDDVTEKLITALDNSGGGSGSQYVLPVAGSADDVDPLLGGVIIGDGLVIDPETGVLSTEGGGGGGGDIPYASKLQAGIMKPGNGLSDGHDNGTVDVMVDNDTIVIDPQTGRLKAQKSFTPQDLPVATENTVGVVKGKSSLNTNEGKVNIANDGAMSVAIDNDYIKRKSDGSITVNPEKIGSASGINVGEGLEKPDSNTIAMKRGTPTQLGGWKPDARDFYKENGKDMIQLKPNGGIEHTAEGLAVTGGGGGGGTTYSAGNGIDITNDEISVKADSASNNAVKVTSAGVKVSIDNSTIHPLGVDGPLRVSTKNESIGGVRAAQGFNELLDNYRVDTPQPGKYLNLNDNLSKEIFRRYTKGRLIPTKVTFSANNTPEQVRYLGSFGYIYNDGENDGALGGIQVELSGTITDPDNAPTITGPTFAVGDTLFQLKPAMGAGYNTSYTVGSGIQADSITLIPLKCKTTFSASLIAELVWSSDLGQWEVKLKDNVNLTTYLEISEDSDLELTDFAKKASFSKNDEIPYINIYNGDADATDYADVGGYSAEAYDRLTVPSNLYGRRCMLFFPFSLYVMPNVTDNPFDDANHFVWTGKLITATYTLGYGDMYGEAATVGTFVPFYERTMVLGSDYVSGNSGGSEMTTSNGAPLGDWLVLDYDPNRPGGGGTDPSAVGNVRNRYQSVELIPSDARDILLFVTIRAVDLTSGVIQQWTSRVTPSGTPIFRPHGLMGIVPID